mgnify:CR=1 FL=1
MTPKQKLYHYRRLRDAFSARTMVSHPALPATMHAMDVTEDYLLFQAMLVEDPLPLQEEYLEKVKRTREVSSVNLRAANLWRSAKKHWSFRDLLAQITV